MFNTLKEGPIVNVEGIWIFAFIRGSNLLRFLLQSICENLRKFAVQLFLVAANGCSKFFRG